MNKLWFLLMGTMQRKKNSGHTAGRRRFWHVHSCGALMAKVTAAGLDCFKRNMEARRLQPRCHPPLSPQDPRFPCAHSEFDEVCRSFGGGGRSAADVAWRSAGSGLWTTNTETRRMKSSGSGSSRQQQRQQVGANFDPLLGKKRGGKKRCNSK